jgi:transposase
MSLQPEKLPEVPLETARIARSLFPKGNRYMWLRDELGAIYTDEQFAKLYPGKGQLAEQPWRLALVSIMQYMENYTDRQAAEAMKTRIDWKYALSLELTDPGFDFSLLSEFRSRLIGGEIEEVLLTTLLKVCRERGWLKERGKQRTDSTHVEAAIRAMNRLECAAETLRAALNSLAVIVPGWLRAHVPQDWHDRYDKRIEDFRFPKEKTKRQALSEQIGQDGWDLLTWVREEGPAWLREVPAVETLRQVWIQQFWVNEGKVGFRSDDMIPPASQMITSPYDTEARRSAKRDTVWTGYKVHLTETCDDHTPHVIINVETTPATTHDMNMTEVIHEDLERKQLLPSEHLMDAGYVDGEHLVNSKKQYEIELVGPVAVNGTWQAKAGNGFDISQFQVDWENKSVTCPEGKLSRKWTERADFQDFEVIRAQFGKADCLACPSRALCTRSETAPRQLIFRTQEQHEAIQAARQRQTTLPFKERYAKRAGVEGTISQGARAFGIHDSRYIGLVKNHLQHLITATAMNIARLFSWQMEDTHFQPRISRFAALAA